MAIDASMKETVCQVKLLPIGYRSGALIGWILM
jgi:hypothetical protein